MTALAPGGGRRSTYLFWLCAALVITVVGGFARSFFLQPLFGPEPLTAALIFHGLCGTAWFALLVGFAFATRHQPEVHKRLMILATVTMMAPAFSRISRLFRGGGPPPFDSAFAAALFIAAMALYDWRRLGRIHGVTLGVGAGYLAWVAVRQPLARSDWWADMITPLLIGA